MSSDRTIENLAWFTAGMMVGAVASMLLIFILSRRISHIEIVRDASGRIVQIIEMDDIRPVSGERIVNVGAIQEKSTP